MIGIGWYKMSSTTIKHFMASNSKIKKMIVEEIHDPPLVGFLGLSLRLLEGKQSLGRENCNVPNNQK